MNYLDPVTSDGLKAAHEAELEASIESKVVCIRDGSCTYTAEEVCGNLIAEACGILDVNPENFGYEYDEDDPDGLTEYEALSSIADEYESKLADAGYTVVWNDGFVIYKDLTDEELEYLNG